MTKRETFYVCKFKESSKSPWAGMDRGSGGYPYPAGDNPLDTTVYRWHVSQVRAAREYAAGFPSGLGLDLYVVTIDYEDAGNGGVDAKVAIRLL